MPFKQTWKQVLQELRHFDFRSLKNMGIGKALLLWFLVISLVPLATLSFINFFYYYQGLNILAKKSLFTTTELRINYLDNYFDELDRYLSNLSENQSDLAPLKNRYRPEGIENIYMVDSNGIIRDELFQNADLGQSLLTGQLSLTKFGNSVKWVMQHDRTLFSDLEFYPPGSNQISGFLVKPLLTSKGRKSGVIALKISTEKIDHAVHFGIVFGSTGYSYLVGDDLKLRAASKISDSIKTLVTSESNEKTRIWQNSVINHTTLTPKASMVSEEVEVYSNSRGQSVMGVYRNLDHLEKFGVHWALVEEFAQEEAHMVAARLSVFAKISLILTTILVLLISSYVTSLFVSPIKNIADWAKQVAHGELVIRDIQVANNEVGKMKDAFNWLVHSLRSFAEVSQSASLGDYSKTVTVRSEKDVMAITMNQMVESFKDVVRQAGSIAKGDYSTNIVPRSEHDTLGIALYEMTRKLREASVEINNRDWLKTGINELRMLIRGDKSISALSSEVIRFLCNYLPAITGHLYLTINGGGLQRIASYAAITHDDYPGIIEPGQGLVGQAAIDQKTIFISKTGNNNPATGVMDFHPEHFMIAPVVFEGVLIGVLELGTLEPFSEQMINFVQVSVDDISVAVHTARSREKVQELLTKTQEQATALVSQAKELENASNYKSEFLANMSHELRTPLNSILVLSELLASNSKGELSPQEMEYAAVIHNSGKDLLDLINDILDLSKVEAGKFEIEMEEMKLDELPAYVRSVFFPLTSKKGIYLETGLAEDLPEVLITDGLRVRQIIKNLISNAIKFTEKGGITFSVERALEGTRFHNPGHNHENMIAIRVKDTGIGIPRAKMEMIFEAFNQADGTINRKFGGTGLGLTISKSLATLLNGEIHVTSRENKGSTFTLYLPLRDHKPAARVTEHRYEPRVHPENKADEQDDPITSEVELHDRILENTRILVCDDDMRNVFVLSRILEEKKVNVIIARNGQEAIDKLNEHPDTQMLLIDLMMPVMDGLTAIREIRKDERFTQLPIIAVTAKAMKGDKESCLEAGANDYLAKPISQEKLLGKLKHWIPKA